MFANQPPAVWARTHKNGCTNTLKQAKLHSQLRHRWVQTKHKHLNKWGGSFPRRPTPPPRLISAFSSHALKHKYTWMPWHQLLSSVLIKSCLLNQVAVVVRSALHLLLKHLSHYSRFSHQLSLRSHNFHGTYARSICVNTNSKLVWTSRFLLIADLFL